MDRYKLLDKIYWELCYAENYTIELDENREVYLYDDDTKKKLGNPHRIETIFLKKQDGQIFVSVDSDETQIDPREYWLIDNSFSDYEVELIYNAFFGDIDEEEDDDDEDDEYGNPTHDADKLIEKLELDDEMSCVEIFVKVFDYLDDNEDGQIPRSIVVATADGITREICQHFDIEFVTNEW